VIEVSLMGRPPFPIEVQRVFWQRVGEGSSVVDAARLAGVSKATGERFFSRSGGVIPSFAAPVSGARLSLDERHQIAALRRAGFSIRGVAREIGRDPATVSRELSRNASSQGVYLAAAAQAKTDQRARDRGRAASPAKLAVNLSLRREVQNRLHKHHSPRQIARRLREEFPDDPEMWVSHETIYQSLYVQGRGGLRRELTTCLRTGRALRRPRRQAQARQAKQSRIKDMVMISERPAEVADRAVPGHWEGDLIMGAGNASAIGTLVERSTRFVMLLHLPGDHTAPTVADAMVTAMTGLPDFLRRTLTWDQGSEMANHAQITDATGLEIYFCDPASPWQRGSNENTNGLLRQYFPKGTDLSFWGPGYLEMVAAELNGRPRETLNWRTPAEALDQLLSEHDNQPGVALNP
jgi:transposase, IS30 family